MPRYLDKEDKNGVRITVNPKGILRGHKKLKNLISPPVPVGKNIKLVIKFEKLKNFNEPLIENFWFSRAILEKLPGRGVVNIENIKFLENERVFEKEIESEFTSCEGDAVYKVGNRHSIHLSFYSKDAFPLYTANVRSTEWGKRDLIIMIWGGAIVFVITKIIFPLLGL